MMSELIKVKSLLDFGCAFIDLTDLFVDVQK